MPLCYAHFHPNGSFVSITDRSQKKVVHYTISDTWHSAKLDETMWTPFFPSFANRTLQRQSLPSPQRVGLPNSWCKPVVWRAVGPFCRWEVDAQFSLLVRSYEHTVHPSKWYPFFFNRGDLSSFTNYKSCLDKQMASFLPVCIFLPFTRWM